MPPQKPIERAKANFNQGNQLKEQGMVAESIESYQKALQIKPDYTQPLVKLAAIYEEQENWLEAAKCYQRMIGLKPENPTDYINLAKVLRKQNNIDGAISVYQKAIELQSEQPAWVFIGLGDALHQNGQLEDAIATYQQALEIKPDNSRVYVKLAGVMRAQKNIQGAIEAYQKAIELQPEQPAWVYIDLGNALNQNGDDGLNNRQNKFDYPALLREKGFALAGQLKLNEASKLLQAFGQLRPDRVGEVFEEASRIIMTCKEVDLARAMWTKNSKFIQNFLCEYFSEKLEKDIPCVKVSDLQSIKLTEPELKRYKIIPKKYQVDCNKGIDSLGGLLSYEVEELYKNGKFKNPIYNYRNYQVSTIPNVVFAETQTLSSLFGYTPMSLDGYYIKRLTQGNNPESLLAYYSSKIDTAKIKYRQNTVFIMPGVGQNRYYHALCDTLPALIIYKELKLDCPIVFPRFPVELQPHLKELPQKFLNLLNIPEECLLTPKRLRETVFTMGIAPQPFCSDIRLIEFYRDISSKLSEKLSKETSPYSSRVYISRRNAQRRSLANEPEIENLLSAMGFSIIQMENLSFEEQFKLMQNASIIVAPHGAGLTNMLFCKIGVTIVEFCLGNRSFPSGIRNCFYTIATLCGHKYYPIVCDLDSKSSRIMNPQNNSYSYRLNGIDLQWKLDLNKLQQVLEKVMT